jgi:phosphogluconate dehydratase
MARAAGLIIDWTDFADLSAITPLLARIYPNGQADVNHFHAAGGMAFLTRELLDAGLLHRDVMTITGSGLDAYAREPRLIDGQLLWQDAVTSSHDLDVLRPVEKPFDAEGGLRLLTGNLGRAIIKLSAVSAQHRVVEAPAIVFNDQADFDAAFKRGDLNRDFVAVLRFQGPRANGMPELHSLSPALSVLQDRGFKVALVTDGRMSGASGKTPAAIHVTPEASDGGPIARLADGDIIRVDGERGQLQFIGDPSALLARPIAHAPRMRPGMGRELFDNFRKLANAGEMGASVLF